MQPMHVEAGATIFCAGDPSAAVYIIEDGEIAITVGEGGHWTEVARLHAGELFGESGVLEARPRAATATAITDATLLVTEAETFFSAFGLNNDRALTLVKLLCQRLRSTNLRMSQSDLPAAAAVAQTARAAIRLLPDHATLTDEYGLGPLDVSHLPFQVGNRFGGETLAIASNRSCCIPAHGVTDLAAPHFEILRRSGKLGVRDLGSRHGTIVNGTPITRASIDPFMPLHAGHNEVIAGRPNSPFRFCVEFHGA